ncbi:UNVERIFIED_CONTAM: hypothetical protein Sradi_5811800 [Sesamum radiatum]|uniref:Retrotransposon gag domain-containing protein n=1 Tax=Sesamum radiatum TaxID=300843 RepID=A0AAW2KRQ5_SESRA
MHPHVQMHKPLLNLAAHHPVSLPILSLIKVENYPRLPKRRSKGRKRVDETGDPQEHLDKFYAKIDWYDLNDTVYCKVFRTMLKHAVAWFNQLPAGTISSLEQLTQYFLHHFSMNKKKENELLRDYLHRFVEAVHEVPYMNHELLASVIQQNLLSGIFKESVVGKPPINLEELLMRSQKYIMIEESNVSDTSLSGKRKGSEEKKEPKKKKKCKHLAPTGFTHYTPLNAPKSEILVMAEQQGLINQWPRKMKDNPKRLKSDKYCCLPA